MNRPVYFIAITPGGAAVVTSEMKTQGGERFRISELFRDKDAMSAARAGALAAARQQQVHARIFGTGVPFRWLARLVVFVLKRSAKIRTDAYEHAGSI